MGILKRLTGRETKQPAAEPREGKRRPVAKEDAEKRLRENSPWLFDDGPGRRGQQNRP